MPTNFDFLKPNTQFSSFIETAVQAEIVLHISPALCATACRTALEFAVKWLYSVDKYLAKPSDTRLAALISSEYLRDLLPKGLFPKIDYIRKIGNNATHKGNIPLTPSDVKALEHLLWNELGTKEQYDEHCKCMPLGEFVRSVVGLSQHAANEAFSAFLNNAGLDSRQMHFVRHIVSYIVKNGMIKDIAILRESPFSDLGGIGEVFDDVAVFTRLRTVIETINANAAA